MERAQRAYKDAEFSEEQMIFFLKRAAVVEQDVMCFVLLHKHTTHDEFVTCVKDLEYSRHIFGVGLEESGSGALPSVGVGGELRRGAPPPAGRTNRMAEISLIVRQESLQDPREDPVT